MFENVTSNIKKNVTCPTLTVNASKGRHYEEESATWLHKVGLVTLKPMNSHPYAVCSMKPA